MNEPTNHAQEHSDPVGAPGRQASTDPAMGYYTAQVPSGRSNSDRLSTQLHLRRLQYTIC